MSTLLVILSVVFLFSLVGGAAMWFFLRGGSVARADRPAPETTPPAAEASATAAGFRWRYISLPLAVLVLSVAMVGYFSRLLPAEVAYHFQADGSPDAWLSRSAILLWALLPQFFLTLLAGGVTWGIARLGATFTEVTATVRMDQLLLMMGNMVAIPQVIICFAIVDVFSYNSYQIHILPLWVFALIVMVAGTVVLGTFFYRTFRQTWGASR